MANRISVTIFVAEIQDGSVLTPSQLRGNPDESK